MTIVPKKFSKLDIPIRVAWINDERINKSMSFSLPASIEATEVWFVNNIGNTKRADFSFFDEFGELIAMGGFTNINQQNQNAEFYIMVNPNMQGKGIGKQVSLWLFNYGFSVIKLNKIYLYTDDDNIKAYNIYEKAGFLLEGTLRQHHFRKSTWTNKRFYGLLRSEWNTKNWKRNIYNEV